VQKIRGWHVTYDKATDIFRVHGAGEVLLYRPAPSKGAAGPPAPGTPPALGSSNPSRGDPFTRVSGPAGPRGRPFRHRSGLSNRRTDQGLVPGAEAACPCPLGADRIAFQHEMAGNPRPWRRRVAGPPAAGRLPGRRPGPPTAPWPTRTRTSTPTTPPREFVALVSQFLLVISDAGPRPGRRPRRTTS